jgi:hypothetical protein
MTAEKASVKRCRCVLAGNYIPIARMEEDQDGDWIAFPDFTALQREHDALKAENEKLRAQVSALSKIDERGMGHDDAMSAIAHHVHEIQVLCDAFGYDPCEWLQDHVANELEEKPVGAALQAAEGEG